MFFGVFVGLQAEGQPPSGSQEAACAIDEFKAQAAYGFEGPSIGVFPGAIAFCQAGFDLEVGHPEAVRLYFPALEFAWNLGSIVGESPSSFHAETVIRTGDASLMIDAYMYCRGL